jgi:signal transduction histidine kinase
MLMLPENDDTPPPPYDPVDQLRHDLKTPLTTISGHAQLLGRVVRRTPSLTDAERGRMLAGLAAIQAAVREMVAHIDAISGERLGRADDETAPPP